MKNWGNRYLMPIIAITHAMAILKKTAIISVKNEKSGWLNIWLIF
jgi:hypothetical protein